MLHTIKANNGYGGVRLGDSTNLLSHQLDVTTKAELFAAKVISRRSNIILATIYRPPHRNEESKDVNVLNQIFQMAARRPHPAHSALKSGMQPCTDKRKYYISNLMSMLFNFQRFLHNCNLWLSSCMFSMQNLCYKWLKPVCQACNMSIWPFCIFGHTIWPFQQIDWELLC